MLFANMPIRQKLMAANLLTSGTVLLLTCSAFIAYEIITLRKGMVEGYHTRAEIIAANSTAALAFQNEADAAEVLGALKTDPKVTGACLYDGQGKVFAKYPVDAPAGSFPPASGESGYRSGHLEIFCPVAQGERKLGTVYIQSDLSALTDHYRAYAALAAAIIAGSLLVGFLLSRRLQKQISTPILALAETARAISDRGDFSARAQKLSEDELGLLTDAFNRMLVEIQAQNQALKASEERFRAMIENSADGIAVSDSEGKALYASPALTRMLGFTEGDLVGKNRKDLIHPDDLPSVMEKMDETLRTPGKTIQARYRLQHKDGSWRWIDMTATNLLDNPAVGGIVRNIRDVTEKMKMEEIARLGEAQAIENIKSYAIIMLDKDGRVLTWNAGAEAIKGYKRSEITGKHFSTFYTPEDRAKGHAEELLKIAAKEGRVEEEGWRVKKDGSRFMADVVITALKDEKGELKGFIKVTRDVTEIKKAEEEIKQTNDFLNAVLENIPNMIFVKDAKDLRFVRFNRAGEELLGLSQKELLGKNDFDFFPKEQADFFTAKDRAVLQKGKMLDIPEEAIETKAKGKRLLHTKKIPIQDKAGAPRYLLGISEDITEQKRQQQREIYMKALETSNKEMQDFIFVASHDLQEPLRKIQSFGNFLQDEVKGSISPDGADYLHRMQDAARRMGILIEDLLQITRVTTKAKPFEQTDMNQVLKDVISDLEIRVQETGGKVLVDDLPRLEADPTQMRQLFQNLIGNALKFHQKDIPPVVEVKVKIDALNDHCVIQVKDNGIGFEPKYTEKIFNIFQRLNGSEFEGTGIGLAVCRKVVERHNGTITAKSYLGQGALFEITLPLHQQPQGGNS